jgi:hypothetical protein
MAASTTPSAQLRFGVRPPGTAQVCSNTVRFVPFRTPLSVRHDLGEEWLLLEPLVFEGRDEFFVIRKGFKTDFASIPRPVRWLIDTAGSNSEPGVLHDAVWRESKRTDRDPPRVDPWDADGLFRRALRESGATAITRSLMWIAVRAAAIVAGRVGKEGPSAPMKVVQLVVMALVGAVAIGIPSVVAVVGRAFYWVIEWLVAGPMYLYEKHRGTGSNLPWPLSRKRKVEAAKSAPEAERDEHEIKGPPNEVLMVIVKTDPGGLALAAMLGGGNDRVLVDEELDSLPNEELAQAY